MLDIRFDDMKTVPQDAVYVTFNGGRTWTLIGYMLHRNNAPFCALFEFSDMAEDDREEILELIWKAKGQREAKIPTRPPARLFPESS